MEKLGIPTIQLKPTKLTLHGIVPGHSYTPMGRIQLEVLFGEKDNYCREPIWFEVVDLNSPYHVLLGRPALARFMAVPHYAYYNGQAPPPLKDLRQRRGICFEYACPRGKALYKAACSQAEGQRTAGPTPRSQPRKSRQPGNRTLTCNQAPAYIRGPRPLE
jgi:hypothetical protein